MSSETHAGGITFPFSPCEAAVKASMDCLEKNNYKRSQCLHMFEAYKECKKTWVRSSFRDPWSLLIRSKLAQRRADRRAGKDASLV